MTKYTTLALRVIATACAVGLVIASVGFGAVFAYRVGIQHSLLLAILTVIFAIALDVVKPLVIASAFNSFSQFKLITGFVMLALGVVAVAYSLTSELSLMSMSRGDLAAKRQSTINHSNGVSEAHQRAKSELVRLKSSRPPGEVRADIAGIENLPGIQIDGAPCGGIFDGPVTQTNCPKLHLLKAELARAIRLEQLQALLIVGPESEATNTHVKAADPGSKALVAYLGALGIVVTVDAVAQWLNLVPVLALELGSAFAAVLVQSVGQLGVGSSKVVQKARKNKGEPREPLGRTMIEAKLVSHVRDNGGRVNGSERELARQFGTSKPTIRRAILSLSTCGVIVANSTRNGTTLLLAQ